MVCAVPSTAKERIGAVLCAVQIRAGTGESPIATVAIPDIIVRKTTVAVANEITGDWHVGRTASAIEGTIEGQTFCFNVHPALNVFTYRWRHHVAVFIVPKAFIGETISRRDKQRTRLPRAQARDYVPIAI